MTQTPPPRSPRFDRTHPASRDTDRGVSEVVSFVLTFSIITTMVGILYVSGSVSLAAVQQGNQMQNAEGVFLTMANSFSELQEDQAPKRAGALDLDVGASLTVINDSHVDVVVNGPGYSTSVTTRSLQYRLNDRAVTYESGAVFRTTKDRSAMVGPPPKIFCSPDTNSSVISIVTLAFPDGVSVASGTATVTGVQRSTKLLFPSTRTGGPAVENVSVHVTSPRSAAWNRYFSRANGWTDANGDGTYVCESADRVYVRRTVVAIEFTD